MTLALQGGAGCARPFPGRRVARFLARARRSLAFLRRRKFHPSPPGFRQPNRYGLLRGAGAVLPFPNMVHLFFHEFSGLRGRSFALAFVFSSALQRLFFRHTNLLLVMRNQAMQLFPPWPEPARPFSRIVP